MQQPYRFKTRCHQWQSRRTILQFPQTSPSSHLLILHLRAPLAALCVYHNVAFADIKPQNHLPYIVRQLWPFTFQLCGSNRHPTAPLLYLNILVFTPIAWVPSHVHHNNKEGTRKRKRYQGKWTKYCEHKQLKRWVWKAAIRQRDQQ